MVSNFAGKPTKEPSDIDYIPTVFKTHSVTVHCEPSHLIPDDTTIKEEMQDTYKMAGDIETDAQSSETKDNENRFISHLDTSASPFTVIVGMAKEIKPESLDDSHGNSN